MYYNSRKLRISYKLRINLKKMVSRVRLLLYFDHTYYFDHAFQNYVKNLSISSKISKHSLRVRYIEQN